MAGSATLKWFADRGFELELAADLEDIQLRFAAVPVPADGTDELADGVELNKIDILFKCQAAIDGAPAQLQNATIRVADGKLSLEAGLEDVENGLLYPLETELPCPMPTGVPAHGGPRNISPDEDDLDWGDETTFEVVMGDIPDVGLLTEESDGEEAGAAGSSEPAGGLARLLDALKKIDDEPEVDLPPLEEDDTPLPPLPGAEASATDQKMSPIDEATFFLDLLVKREDLELEDDHEVSELARGASHILQGRSGPEAMAAQLSEWLLEQDAVADLFIDDETLAGLLSTW